MPAETASKGKEGRIEEFLYIEGLAPLLPGAAVLCWHARLRILSLLSCEQEQATLLAQAQFSEMEVLILLPLLRSYPHYCPFDVLYASYMYRAGAEQEEVIQRTRERLEEARQAGVWDHEMKQLRNLVHRIRFKLRDFHLEPVSMLETGYLLVKRSGRERLAAQPSDAGTA